MDSASSWMQVEERTELHTGRSEAKVARGLGIGWLWQSWGREAEVRVRVIPTSGSLGILHWVANLSSMRSPWPR